MQIYVASEWLPFFFEIFFASCFIMWGNWFELGKKFGFLEHFFFKNYVYRQVQTGSKIVLCVFVSLLILLWKIDWFKNHKGQCHVSV